MGAIFGSILAMLLKFCNIISDNPVTDCQHLIDSAFSSIAGQFMNGANMGFQLLKGIVHFFHLQDRDIFRLKIPFT